MVNPEMFEPYMGCYVRIDTDMEDNRGYIGRLGQCNVEGGFVELDPGYREEDGTELVQTAIQLVLKQNPDFEFAASMHPEEFLAEMSETFTPEVVAEKIGTPISIALDQIVAISKVKLH